MKEIREIITAFDEAQKFGNQTALATVVHVDGSSYRRPGARMLIREDGQLTGAISGGCLEGDALRKALLAMSQQKAKLVTYDTSDEDDAKLGMGLGCNGIIQVLIEPINALDPNNPVQLLKALASKRQQHILITLFSPEKKMDEQHGTCLLISEDGKVCGHAPILHETLMKDAALAFESKNSTFKKYNSKDNTQVAFIEVIKPSVCVIIIGAGNDAIPLAKMADVLGWETIVVDGRPEYAKKDRFVTACHVLVSKPESVLDKVIVDDQTVFLLLTHNYNYDLAMLRALLKKQVAYIGCLGPKTKLDRMIVELRDDGVVVTDEQMSALYGPVGLDIGAETSEEIALSILAEIKAVLSSKNGQSLRTNAGTIHSRSALRIDQVDIQK